MPSFATISGGTILDAKTLRKIVRNSASSPPTPYRSKLPSASMSFRCNWDVSVFSGGGSGIKFLFPAGPARPSECIAIPSVGALTTVRFGWGFSATGVDGVRATPPPRGAPNIGGAGFGLGLGLDGDVEGAEVDADVPRAEAIRAASSRISACARSISSTARCCSSSASSGDLVVMPRTAATANDERGSASRWVARTARERAVAVDAVRRAREDDTRIAPSSEPPSLLVCPIASTIRTTNRGEASAKRGAARVRVESRPRIDKGDSTSTISKVERGHSC